MPLFFIQYKLYLEYMLWLWRRDIQIYLLSLAANIFTNPIFCFKFWTKNMILREIKEGFLEVFFPWILDIFKAPTSLVAPNFAWNLNSVLVSLCNK